MFFGDLFCEKKTTKEENLLRKEHKTKGRGRIRTQERHTRQDKQHKKGKTRFWRGVPFDDDSLACCVQATPKGVVLT